MVGGDVVYRHRSDPAASGDHQRGEDPSTAASDAAILLLFVIARGSWSPWGT